MCAGNFLSPARFFHGEGVGGMLEGYSIRKAVTSGSHTYDYINKCLTFRRELLGW